MAMKVIGVVNQKGGSGKSTTSIHLAAELLNRGYNVLLIDADVTEPDDVGYKGQQSVTLWAGQYEGDMPFDVVSMTSRQINSHLKRHYHTYDYVVIDTAPRANKRATSTIVADCHFALIPLQPSYFDVWASADIYDIVKARQETTKGIPGYGKEGLPQAAFCLTGVQTNTIVTGETKQALEEVDLPTLKARIVRRTGFIQCIGTGETVFTHKKRDTEAMNDIRAVVDEILEAIESYAV